MKRIFLDNDWELIWNGTRRNTNSGEREPASGIANLSAHISATDGGPTIHASLSKSMAERSLTPGQYFAVLDGTDLRTHLAGSIGAFVWEVFMDSGNVKYTVPRRVTEFRRP